MFSDRSSVDVICLCLDCFLVRSGLIMASCLHSKSQKPMAYLSR